MPQTISEIYSKFIRAISEEERTLTRQIYRDELAFISRLNDTEKEQYIKIRMDNYHLNKLTDKKAFEHGFYIAYKLTQEMKKGALELYNLTDSLNVD